MSPPLLVVCMDSFKSTHRNRKSNKMATTCRLSKRWSKFRRFLITSSMFYVTTYCKDETGEEWTAQRCCDAAHEATTVPGNKKTCQVTVSLSVGIYRCRAPAVSLLSVWFKTNKKEEQRMETKEVANVQGGGPKFLGPFKRRFGDNGIHSTFKQFQHSERSQK